MRSELKALQREIGATTIYVTHDQVEALTLADHLVVLRDGVIEDEGAPAEIFARPANVFVADFVGRMNFFSGTVAGGELALDGGGVATVGAGVPDGLPILGARPEEIGLGPAEGAVLTIAAQIVASELLGAELLVTACAGEHRFSARVPVGHPMDEVMTFHVLADKLHVFDASGKRKDAKEAP
jgi:ABC-type sugar transport system ATPase subunit